MDGPWYAAAVMPLVAVFAVGFGYMLGAGVGTQLAAAARCWWAWHTRGDA